MNIKNHDSIIECGKITIENGYLPYRYVLRYVPDSFHQYVTHREILKLEGDTFVHDSFECGHYFTTKELAAIDLEKR